MSTIFQKIIDREIPADIVFENDDILAFNDNEPKAPIHILIIPKVPIATINDLDEQSVDVVSKMVLAAKQIAKEKGISESGYRLVMNCNKDGGQSVYHLHCHLLGGKQLGWNPA